MTGGSHLRGPPVSGRVRVREAARAGCWPSWADAAGLGRRERPAWAGPEAGVGQKWGGKRERKKYLFFLQNRNSKPFCQPISKLFSNHTSK